MRKYQVNTNSVTIQSESIFVDRHFGLRFLLVLLVGVVAAFILTWFMYVLIQSSEMKLDETSRIHMLDFVRLKRDEVSQRQERKPERPQVEEAPPAPATPQSDAAASDVAALGIADMPTSTDMDINTGGFSFGAGEGEYLPIVKVAPIYPATAAARGIEGVCMVEYTVTVNGSTRDVRVIDEQCSNTVFKRPSIDAAQKFKYKPRVVNGEPVEVTGVRNMFTYVLENANSGGNGG